MSREPWVLTAILVGFAGWCGPDKLSSAEQEQAAIAALQKRCHDAIEAAERSVGSLLRVPKNREESGLQVPRFATPAARPEEQLLPGDSDFVPTEYGAIVVLEANGLLVTTCHALGDRQRSEYWVWLQHRAYPATLVAADEWIDLAVLRIEAADLVPLRFAQQDAVKKGDLVLVLGNPQALARDGEPAVAWGMVANVRRPAPATEAPTRDGARRETLHHHGTLLQLEGPFDLGYVGGPVINLTGEGIGLLTGYSAGPEAARLARLAVPVDQAFREAVNQLKAGQTPKFGFLGVGLRELDARQRRQGRHGAVVESVLADTPAGRAELQIGDVITHINDRPIYSDDDVIREVGGRRPGVEIRVSGWRGAGPPNSGKSFTRQVKLGERASAADRPLDRDPPERK